MLASDNFLIPNGTFLGVLVIFLVVLGVLWAFVLPPVNKAMDERQRRLSEGTRNSEEGRSLMAATAEERQRILEEGRGEARATVDAATREAEAGRSLVLAQAQAEHDSVLADASLAAAKAIEAAALSLRDDQDAFARDVATKALGAPLRQGGVAGGRSPQ